MATSRRFPTPAGAKPPPLPRAAKARPKRARSRLDAALHLLAVDPFRRLRTDEELAELVAETARRTPSPYSELIHLLMGSERELDEAAARGLWLECVAHRRHLSARLGRPVHLRVAVLDRLYSSAGAARPRPLVLTRDFVSALVENATTEPVSGLVTRDRFLGVLSQELLQRRRVVVSLLSVEGLDGVAHEHGHVAVDGVLKSFGEAARAETLSGDLVGRVGETMFACLFGKDDTAEAEAAMRRLRSHVLELTSPLPLRVLAAIAPSRPGESATALLARANKAMRSRREAPATAPLALPASHRPITVYVTRRASDLLALHTVFAELGYPMLPARDEATAAALVRLGHPRLLLADAIAPPRGGQALLDALATSAEKRLVVPWSSRTGFKKRGVLRVPLARDRAAALLPGLLGAPLSPLPPLGGEVAARAFSDAVHAAIRTGSFAASTTTERPELDLLRRLMGA